MTIGERLYKLRKDKNISQEELANELNVSRQTISKWETGESSPDFDKIIPLCNYFNITSDELLSGKENIIEANKEQNKKIFARNIAISVGLYILSIASIILVEEIFHQEALAVISFFVICAIATCLIIYTCIVHKSPEEKTTTNKEESQTLKLIKDIISILGVIIYFTVSFLTMAWHITWIIFIIVGLCNTIATLIYNLKKKEDNSNE